MVPLPSWLQKLDLNEFPISELFEDLLSSNLESKLITPKYIAGTYFGAIVAIFNSIFSVCFLCVMLFLTPEWTPKAGPATCFNLVLFLPCNITINISPTWFLFLQNTFIYRMVCLYSGYDCNELYL